MTHTLRQSSWVSSWGVHLVIKIDKSKLPCWLLSASISRGGIFWVRCFRWTVLTFHQSLTACSLWRLPNVAKHFKMFTFCEIGTQPNLYGWKRVRISPDCIPFYPSKSCVCVLSALTCRAEGTGGFTILIWQIWSLNPNVCVHRRLKKLWALRLTAFICQLVWRVEQISCKATLHISREI